MPVGIFPVGVFPAPVGTSPVTSSCSVAAASTVTATLEQLAALRDQPGGPGTVVIPPRFLRHADEQTVVGLAAVLRTLDNPALQAVSYSHWGVVAAPVFPGRLASAGTFTKYRENGAAVVSPHSIPQSSLHSVAGAISICLGVHGPNFGIGGGWHALAEGLTVALSLLDHGQLPGLWLVLTQWLPEPIPDGTGSTRSPAACLGTALALRPGTYAGATLRLTLTGHSPAVETAGHRPVPGTDALCLDRSQALVALTRMLTSDSLSSSAAPWSLDLPWGGRVELVPGQHQQHAKAA